MNAQNVPMIAKDGAVQPRLRTLIWKEMPPIVRRAHVAWRRRLLRFEFLIAHIFLSWKRNPTWNFVALAGTAGIFLTILLFLTPWGLEPEARAALTKPRIIGKRRPAWEIDSQLLLIRKPKSSSYPVEIQFLDHRRWMTEEEPLAPRRRRSPVVNDPPLTPLFVPEPMPVAVQPPRRDWVAEERPRPPRLSMETEVVTPPRRPRREPFVADTTWTGRTFVPQLDEFADFGEFDPLDDWKPFDATRPLRPRRHRSDDVLDEETMIGVAEEIVLGDPWEPLPIPEAAASQADVQLELTWDRAARTPRRQPQLTIRNLGPESLERIDVIRGHIPDADWTSPMDIRSQAVTDLPSGRRESVILPIPHTGRRTTAQRVTVLITTFVGAVTRVPADVAERPRPAAHSQERPIPVRESDRPHLSMDVGKPGKLPLEKMVSVPIKVQNDGNVTLYDVVIIVDVPATLDHKYGRKVHYRLGKMAAGELKRATLLLTPLEAGSSSVPLRVQDGKQLASDEGDVNIDVTAEEIAERKELTRPNRNSPSDTLENSRPPKF